MLHDFLKYRPSRLKPFPTFFLSNNGCLKLKFGEESLISRFYNEATFQNRLKNKNKKLAFTTPTLIRNPKT